MGQFTIEARLGGGSMGVIYLARQLGLDRKVVVKVIRNDVLTHETRERFRREARLLAQIEHPGIVTVHNIGIQDDFIFIAMEFVPGQPLSGLVFAEMTLDRVVDIAIQVAGAMAAAHEQGVLHRDLKPANIMLVGDRIKVLDFGLAKEIGEMSDISRASRVYGPPGYIAPEQAQGQPVDGRADQYALGVVLYEMATCSQLFVADSSFELIMAHVMQEPDPPSLRAPWRGISPELEELILRALAKRAEDRFHSMAELGGALAECTRKNPGW